MKPISIAMLALACATLAACEFHRNNSSWPTKAPNPTTTPAASGGAAPSASSGKGVGPVDHVDMAALDESKQDEGAAPFQTKCSACHKLDERYIGPALVGVTERRQPEWILNMILNPDVMIKKDPTAMTLLATFLTPMANQHLTREEAECVLVYFRAHDKEIRQAEHEDKTESQGTSAIGQTVDGH